MKVSRSRHEQMKIWALTILDEYAVESDLRSRPEL